jgi:hypothetical protein
MFQEDLDRRILVSVHSRFSMVGFAIPWNTRMDRPCWGMPQQGLVMPSPSEFPDFRLQYQIQRRYAQLWLALWSLPYLRVGLCGVFRSVSNERRELPAQAQP